MCINILNYCIDVLCIFTNKEMGINGRYICAVNAPISAALKSGIIIFRSVELRFTGIQFVVVFG